MCKVQNAPCNKYIMSEMCSVKNNLCNKCIHYTYSFIHNYGNMHFAILYLINRDL